MNRAPPSEVDEAVSSPNSAASGVSAGKRAGREEQPGIAEEPACSRGGSDDDDGGDGGDGSRKKLRLSKEQSAVLEESFKEHNTLNPVRKYSHVQGHFSYLTALNTSSPCVGLLYASR